MAEAKRRRAKPTSPAARRSTAARRTASSPVRIRMYRQGIGDCLLVTFPAPDRARHLLIDCGVHTSTPGSNEWMRRIVADVKAATGSRLDALVVTHEHWDHISAFAQPELFRDITIGELWFAWTEDPNDQLAKRLGRDRSLRLAALTAASRSLSGARQAPLKALGAAVADVLTFAEPPDPVRGFSPRTRQALDALKARSVPKRYLKPGDLLESQALFPGVRVYVLGPPRDEALLKDGGGDADVDTYRLAGRGRSFYAAVWAAAKDAPVENGVGDPDHYVPFPFELRWTAAAFGKAFPALAQSYDAPRNAWRRIDSDWLAGSAQLALQLDSDTNNTSLVLAIEIAGERILLFPGDAQIGNWKSWTPLQWTVPTPGGAGKRVGAADLLGRTVFYKVSHHGSHNGTRGPDGLERMTNPDLAAAIPVNRDVAAKLKGWNMPEPALEAALRRSARGRVLRADRTWPGTREPAPAESTPARWRAFSRNVKFGRDAAGDLYIDYFV